MQGKHACYAIMIDVVIQGENMKALSTMLLVSVISAMLPAQAQSVRHDGVRLAWTSHYNGGALKDAYATAIAVTNAGQHFVLAGHQQSGSNGFDSFVARYSAFGKRIWAASYDGPTSGDDRLTAMQVDAAGNVYVTGPSYSAASKDDWATLKFDATGKMLWVARYNGAANGYDSPTALALDHAGNIYVTGISYGIGTYNDFLTIKYDANGAQKWVARYNGPSNGWDGAAALAVDSAFVYIAGATGFLDGPVYITTVKYDHAGLRLWAAHEPNSSQTTAIALDDSGNIFVAGARPGATKFTDYALLKYDRDGTKQWLTQYHGPNRRNDMAAGLVVYQGEPCITGLSTGAGNSKSYTTIKYDAAGAQKWLTHYTGGSAGNDSVTAMTMDRAGNIYLTGMSWADSSYDFATLKYNASGKRQWAARYSDSLDAVAKTLAVDSLGYVYVAGKIGGEITTVKYNASGAQRWAVRHEEPGYPIDSPRALLRDEAKRDGSFYVIGTGNTISSATDILVIKYSHEGLQEWDTRYNHPQNLSDEAADAIVQNGSIFITGTSAGVKGDRGKDIVTLKFEANSKNKWVARFNSSPNASDFAIALTADSLENVYVVGRTYGYSENPAGTIVTIKYNAAGTQEWATYFSSSTTGQNTPVAVAVDRQSNVYVFGESVGSHSWSDYVLIKYNRSGQELWNARYDGTGHYFDSPSAMVLDNSSNIYVTGSSTAFFSPEGDFTTIKYDSSGKQIWVARYDCSQHCHEGPTALVFSSTSSGQFIYVTGWSLNRDSFADCITVKYNTHGQLVWSAKYKSERYKFDIPLAMTVDRDDNVYVVGNTRGSEYLNDVFTVKYNAEGAEQWRTHYAAQNNADDTPFGLLLIPEEQSLLVTVRSKQDWASQITTIKYVQTPVSVEENAVAPPQAYVLAQNYPNPFNASTVIRYALRAASHVTLEVLALSGQTLATLVQEEKAAGEYQQQWQPQDLPSGVYFYRLRVQPVAKAAQAEWIATRKLVLLK